jgi:transcription initiation factor TFIIB
MATSDHTPAGDTCPRCLGAIARTTTEHYCRDCGLVTDAAPIDRGPDWRYSDDPDDDPRRAAPGDRSLPDRGLGADAGTTGHARRDRIDRHAATGSKRDRSRAYATSEIQRMATALGVGDAVAERAKRVFRDLHAAQSLEGFDLDAIAPACLYYTLRERQLGRTAGDVAAVARADEQRVTRRLWWVADAVGLAVPPPSVRARVRVVAGRLDADEPATRRAVDIVSDDVNAAPSVQAALALYRVGPWTQAEVADAADVTPAGLRKLRDRVDFAAGCGETAGQ